MAADAVFQVAATILNETVAALALTVSGPPSRSWVSHTAPPLDCCDVCVVHLDPFQVSDTGPSGGPGNLQALHRVAHPGQVLLANYVVTITRCVSTVDDNGKLPTVAVMEADAARLLEDVWVAWNHLRAQARAGTVFSRCREVDIGGPTPLAPSGACAGWTIPVQAQIDGWTP